MGRLPRSRCLGVWMNGRLVGEWTLSAAGDRFQYAETWLESSYARPLSLSMPFPPNNVPYKGAVVRDWFDNLLPDSLPIRNRLAPRFGAASTEAFDLLEQIGRDCVGAIHLLPVGETPPPSAIEGEPLDEVGVAQQLKATITSSSAFGHTAGNEGDLRISIAGAQEKTALLHHEGRWLRPLGSTPTTHILKLPLGQVGGDLGLDMRQSLENEWLCSRIVRAYGLPVAHCEIVTFQDVTTLVVKRFDRKLSSDGSHLLRLPQEDMCQALGRPTHLKYESDGGPGMPAILELLDAAVDSEADKGTFFTAQLLFWLLRAPDGHAKNFSIHLLPNGAFSLAPLYDVLSTYPVLGSQKGQLSPRRVAMAMAVRGRNSHRRMHDIQRRHWNAMAARHGLDSAEPLIGRIIDTTPEVIRSVRAELPAGFPPEVADPILDGLATSVAQLSRMPAE